MPGKLKVLITLLLIPLVVPSTVFATGGTPTYSDGSKYEVNQVFFGAGGGSETDPTTGGTAQVTVGETGVGNYSSSNYQAYAGYNTTADPFLQIVVTSANLNLGVLDTATTATATATFYVRAWNAHGYVVQTDSPPPQNANSSYYMSTDSSPTSSTTGTEQFGMNLVADTTPASLITDSPASANPVQTTSYAHGAAYGNYTTTNKYAYNNGDAIAESLQSTSSTIYTISYIFNIASSTPAGTYNFNQSIVATATY